MKEQLKLLFCIILTTTLFTSCSSIFYQVYEGKQVGGSNDQTENDDLKISYNIWGPGGNFYFQIYNKSSKPVYIDFARSHFILNGFSFDYFNDEQITVTTSQAKAYTGKISTSSKTVVTHRKQLVEIPPNASIDFAYGTISDLLYEDCNLKKWPGRSSDISFSNDNSPVKFKNYITYSSTYDFSNIAIMQSYFYVDKITNMTRSIFLGKSIDDVNCGKKLLTSHYERPFMGNLNFYNRYMGANAQ